MKTKKHHDNKELFKITTKKKYHKSHDANCRLAKIVDSGFAVDRNNNIVNPGSVVKFSLPGSNRSIIGDVLEIHVDNHVVLSYDDENTNEVLTLFVDAQEILILDK